MLTLVSADLALHAYWADPEDKAALAVWADALTEAGDPRGEYIHLHLAQGDPQAIGTRMRVLERERAAKLVGPARPFLRTWTFGPEGLVVHATCEAKRLVDGFSEIEKLHPRLFLAITAMKTLSIVSEVAKLSLDSIFYLDFTQSTGLTDKALLALASALRRVRHLALPVISAKGFTPAGLARLAEHLEAIEYLHVKYWPSVAPSADEYIDVISTSRGFATLRAVDVEGATKRPPHVVSFNVGCPTAVSWGMFERLAQMKRIAGT